MCFLKLVQTLKQRNINRSVLSSLTELLLLLLSKEEHRELHITRSLSPAGLFNLFDGSTTRWRKKLC